MREIHRWAVFGVAALSLWAVPRGADACGGAMWDEVAHRRDPVLAMAAKKARAAARPPEAVAADLLRAQERLDEGRTGVAMTLVTAAIPDVMEYDARWAKPHVARAMRTLSLAILRSPMSHEAQRDFALTTLEKLVQRDTDDPIARTDLGEALAGLPDRAAEGRAMLEALAAEDLVVHAGGYAALARGRVAKGDEAGAREALGRCVTLAMTSQECRVEIPGAPAS
jgi:predicted Zn-dependent protease